MSQVSVIVTFTAKEGRADEVIATFERAAAAVQAEDGTLHYAVHRSQTSPNCFYVTELYRDQAAYEAHANGTVKSLMAGMREVIEDADVQFATPIMVAKGVQK